MRCFILSCIILCLTGCQMRLSYPKNVGIDEVSGVPTLVEPKPIIFERVRFDLKRGEKMISYPFIRFLFPNVDIGFFRMCNPTMKHRLSKSVVRWNMSHAVFGNWNTDVGRIVEEPLVEMGYDVIPFDGSLFKRYAEEMRSELAFSAKIVDVRVNACSIWDILEFETDLIGGDAYVKIDWEIYDPLRKRIVETITTEGIGFVDDPIEFGMTTLLLNAIRDAAANLGRTEAFYKITTSDYYTPRKNPKEYSSLEIEVDKKPFVKPITEHFNLSRRAVITIRSSQAHGSGFFINDDGYAITNAHVVGDAKSVAVVDFAGVQYMADVLRRDEERDIALVKAPITHNNYLPISKESVKATDTVYAIGTPLKESLKTSITKGIVSAIRFQEKQDLSFYQVDAEVAPGSSGGPLVDELGNVIGVAVQGHGLNGLKTGTAYAYFIPIQDALRYLNIQLVKPEYPR